jgi:hypothetical protein
MISNPSIRCNRNLLIKRSLMGLSPHRSFSCSFSLPSPRPLLSALGFLQPRLAGSGCVSAFSAPQASSLDRQLASCCFLPTLAPRQLSGLHIHTVVVMGFGARVPLRCCVLRLRTSAAAAAALCALPALSLPPPSVLGGPPTFGAGFAEPPAFTFAGTDAFALLEGGGAEPRVRPGP